MNRMIKFSFLLLFSLALAACGSKNNPSTTEQPSGNNPDGSSSQVSTDAPAYSSSSLTRSELEALDIFGDPADEKVMYFEYNSSRIDRRCEVIARAHAWKLRQLGGANVRLDGHADERGTRDYNLALGERRAKAITSLMRAEGAAGSQFQEVSYGEERPVDTGHNENAWRKNRRVEISY